MTRPVAAPSGPGIPGRRRRTLVTIDGPAGSGKSTTARAVADRLGWRYLDSGALYRAVTYALLESGTPPSLWERLAGDDLDGLGLSVEIGEEGIEIALAGRPVADEQLRTERVTDHVSKAAAMPSVRGWLFTAQRSAGTAGRLVADGRDMGTVVFPEATTKIFLKAEPVERARRRLADRDVEAPSQEELEAEVERLLQRDRRDANREVSPLRVPDGALVLDTTALAFEEQVQRIVEEVERRAGR